MNQSEKLLPFFVYAIFEPNENKPFYVGMGQGKRDEAHKSGYKDQKEKKLKEIEDESGRNRDAPKFSARTLDIDIVLQIGDEEILFESDEIEKYSFVSEPLKELL